MKIFGFPEMDLIKGVRRPYPPHLILSIAQSDKVMVYLEEGYGEDIGFTASDYQNENVCFKTKKEVFSESDYIVCITALSARERRTSVSSYSWPFFGSNADRLANVEIYSKQMKPILKFLIDNGHEGIQAPVDLKTTFINDALYGSLNPLTIEQK